MRQCLGPLPSSPPTRIAIVGCGVREHFPFDLAAASYDRACATVAEALPSAEVEIITAAEPFDDPAQLVRYCDQLLASRLGGVIFFHAAYTAGELASQFGRWLAEHRVPLLSWSFPDARGGRLLSNSLCCQNFLLNIWTRLGVSYAWMHEPIGSQADETLRRFARSVRARDRFRHGRALHVGGSRVSGFYDGETNELEVMRRFGLQFDRIDLQVVAEKAARIATHDLHVVRDALLCHPLCSAVDVSSDQIERTLRFGLAIYELAAEKGYVGCTIKSWPEMFSCYGCAIDGAVSMLNDAGLCTVEEGDMNGLLSSMSMHLLSAGAASPMMMDLSSLDLQRNRIGVWHCGASPTRTLKRGTTFEARRHSILENGDNDGAVGMMVEFLLELGTATVARYQSPDATRMMRFAGQLVETEMAFRGSYGEMEPMAPATASQVMGTIMSRGLDHHWSLGYGDLVKDLDMLNHWLGISTVALDADSGSAGLSAGIHDHP